jgi:hypothetical protein
MSGRTGADLCGDTLSHSTQIEGRKPGHLRSESDFDTRPAWPHWKKDGTASLIIRIYKVVLPAAAHQVDDHQLSQKLLNPKKVGYP